MGGSNNFSRKSRGLKPRNIYVIAVEGCKTEYEYFSLLKKKYGIRGLSIKIFKPKKGTSPKQVVSLALAEKSRGVSLWAIVDHDGRSNSEINDAINLAQREGVNIIFSVPLFEYWLLLHDKSPTSKVKVSAQKQKCYQLLATLTGMSKYNKSKLDLNKLINEVEIAIQHAHKMEQDKLKTVPMPHGTRVHWLVEEIIKEAKRLRSEQGLDV